MNTSANKSESASFNESAGQNHNKPMPSFGPRPRHRHRQSAISNMQDKNIDKTKLPFNKSMQSMEPQDHDHDDIPDRRVATDQADISEIPAALTEPEAPNYASKCIVKPEPDIEILPEELVETVDNNIGDAAGDDEPTINTVLIKVEPVIYEEDDPFANTNTEEFIGGGPQFPTEDSQSESTLVNPPVEPTFECDYCWQIFHTKSKIRSHMRFHMKCGFSAQQKFKCHVCEYQSLTSNALRRHINRKHLAVKPKFVCQECDEEFAGFFERSQHFRAAHMQPIDPHIANQYTLIDGARDERYSCPHCELTYDAAREVQAHLAVEHPNEQLRFDVDIRTGRVLLANRKMASAGGRHYRCDICDYTTKMLPEMNTHLSTHSLVKAVRCSRCPYTCSRPKELSIHRQKEHSDLGRIVEQAIVCVACGYRCSNRYALQRHQRTHTDERPFKCTEPGCEVAVKSKEALRRHMMSKHLAEVSLGFRCNVCDMRFAKPYALTKHKKTEHPPERM